LSTEWRRASIAVQSFPPLKATHSSLKLLEEKSHRVNTKKRTMEGDITLNLLKKANGSLKRFVVVPMF